MDNTRPSAPAHGEAEAADTLRGRISRELGGQARAPGYRQRIITPDAPR